MDEKKVKKNGSEINTTKINNHRKEKDQFDNKFTKSAPMKKYNDTKLESQSKANKAVLSLKEKSEVETHGKVEKLISKLRSSPSNKKILFELF